MALPVTVTPPLSGFRLIDGDLINQLIARANFPEAKTTLNATVGATTAAAGDLTGARTVSARYSAVGAANLTTRTAAQMVTDMGNAFFVGMSYLLIITNTSGGTTTLVGGTGVTISGTATMATNTTRTFIVTFDSATAVTIQSIGVGTIS